MLKPAHQGMTIHAWGAVSPTPTDFDFQISCIKKCRPALQRWQKTQVLIVDEGVSDGLLCTTNLTTSGQSRWWTVLFSPEFARWPSI
ncbi:hypothetical protein C8R47DRAFT_965040 [Mycena vitilis]|nr:hypothetical protein C8R47DRAFT_965040 [Mycena vitilis]